LQLVVDLPMPPFPYTASFTCKTSAELAGCIL
jgi:hypothetical protein